MKQLSKEEMKMVIGGRFMAYTCACTGGGSSWFYMSNEQPRQGLIDQDVAETCSSGSANCNWQAYGGEMPEV